MLPTHAYRVSARRTPAAAARRTETVSTHFVFKAYAIVIRSIKTLVPPCVAIAFLGACIDAPLNGGGKACSDVACLEGFRVIVEQSVPSGVPPANVQIELCRNGSCFDPVLTTVSSTHELAIAQGLAYGATFASVGCREAARKPTICIVVYSSGSVPFPKVDGDEFKVTVSDPAASFQPNIFMGKIAYHPYSPDPCKNNDLVCQSGTLSFIDPALSDRD